MSRPLSEVSPGETVYLEDFSKDSILHFKLLSLGVLPGDPIKVISKAPFGGPITIRHGHSVSFAIRKNDAQSISTRKQ
jgi:Fe2+ transport system protein FeoA